MSCLKKRGQVTAFIILGMVILFAFSLAIYVGVKTKSVESPPLMTIDTLATSFTSTMENCFRPKIKQAVSKVGVDKFGLNQYLKLSLKECFDLVSYYGLQVEVKLPLQVKVVERSESYLVEVGLKTKLSFQDQSKQIDKYQILVKKNEVSKLKNPKFNLEGREFVLGDLNKIGNKSFVTGEFIVSYKREIKNDSSYNSTLNKFGLISRSRLFSFEMKEVLGKMVYDEKIVLNTSISYREIRKKLLEYDFVESVSLNSISYPHFSYNLIHKLVRKPSRKVNDPFYKYQWYLKNNGRFFGTIGADIDIESAWDLASSCSVIAVIDQGIFSNPELTPNLLFYQNYDFVEGDRDISPKIKQEIHGSHVAGVVAAQTNDHFGIAGICPQCKILGIRALDEEGGTDSPTLLRAVVYAISQGARVISMSLGKTKYSEYEDRFFKILSKKGIVFIAAAGNDGLSQKNYPAAYDSVIAVGSTDNNDEPSSFSNHGSWVDILAPGEMILSICGTDVYCFSSGTSMAVPMVSGVVGLMLSMDKNLTSAEVKKYLLKGGDYIGYYTPRLNAGQTLSLLEK